MRRAPSCFSSLSFPARSTPSPHAGGDSEGSRPRPVRAGAGRTGDGDRELSLWRLAGLGPLCRGGESDGNRPLPGGGGDRDSRVICRCPRRGGDPTGDDRPESLEAGERRKGGGGGGGGPRSPRMAAGAGRRLGDGEGARTGRRSGGERFRSYLRGGRR
jgi:hypothetical protein